jgi:alpha-galactosidase
MRDALHAAGRPMVFSICEWGNQRPWLWGAKIGHLWRTTGDINPCFDCTIDHGTWKSSGILQILDMQKGLREYAGPGHWNDPDMLEVGNGMSVSEDRAHFTMWCLLAAPLIAGNDLRKVPKDVVEILANKEAIAVDQDSLGIQGFQFSADAVLEIWFKPLADGGWAMGVLNRSPRAQKIVFDWKTKIVVDDFSKRETQFNSTTYRVRDLWAKKDLGTTQSALDAEVPAHDVLLLRLTK